MICLFLILSFLLAAYVLLGYGVFRLACCRGKDVDWMDREAVKKTVYAPYADMIPKASQWLQDHHGQDVFVQSHDGLKLHGCWIEAAQPIGTMILFHGYRSTYLIDFSEIYQLYHSRGYNLLLVSQRAHGSSQGKYITFGVMESRDVEKWLQWHNRSIGPIPVFICGMSMGSATVMYAAGNPLPENVVGMTADCGFTSPYDIMLHVASKRVGNFLANAIMPMVNFWTKKLAGFGLKDCSSEETLKRSRLPILMIHGLEDDFVPCEMSRRGYACCQAPKELILVEKAGHGTSFLYDRNRVEDALIHFFVQNNPNETGDTI